MTLDQMRYLIKIAETHSITAASNRLFITQQALSASIKAMEEELNVQLLNRRSKGVVLTAEGQHVLKTAYQIVQLHDELIEHYKKEKGKNYQRTLRIITNQGIDLLFLPKIISWFYKHYPQVKLDMQTGTAEQIIEAVEQQQADIGLINVLEFEGQCMRKFEPPLKFISYHTNKFVYCTHRNSYFGNYKTISLKSIVKKPLIMVPTDAPEEHLLLQVVKFFGEPEIIWAKSTRLSRLLLLDNMGGSINPIEGAVAIAEQYPEICNIKIKDKFLIYNGLLLNESMPQNDLADIFCKVVFYLKDEALSEFIS